MIEEPMPDPIERHLAERNRQAAYDRAGFPREDQPKGEPMPASDELTQTVQTVRFTREMQFAAWHFLGNLPGGRGGQISMHDIELMFHAMRQTLSPARLREAAPAEEVPAWQLRPMEEFSPRDEYGCARYIAKAQVSEGSVVVVYGTNDKPLGWVDTHAMFKGKVYRDKLLSSPAPAEEVGATDIASQIAADAFKHMPRYGWGEHTTEEVHGAIQIAAAAALSRLQARVRSLETAAESARQLEAEGYKALHYSQELARAEAAESRLAAAALRERAKDEALERPLIYEVEGEFGEIHLTINRVEIGIFGANTKQAAALLKFEAERRAALAQPTEEAK